MKFCRKNQNKLTYLEVGSNSWPLQLVLPSLSRLMNLKTQFRAVQWKSALQLSHDIDNLTEYRKGKHPLAFHTKWFPVKNDCESIEYFYESELMEYFMAHLLTFDTKQLNSITRRKIRKIYRHTRIELSKINSQLILFKARRMERRGRPKFFRFRLSAVISDLLLNCS